jgi:protein gp37
MAGQYWNTQINPVSGCTKASEACLNCYAESLHNRFHGEFNGRFYKNPFNVVTLQPQQLKRFDELAKKKAPQIVFIGNMCDVFHDAVPIEYQWSIFEKLSSNSMKQHTFLFLTKRPENMKRAIEGYGHPWIGGATNQAMETVFPHVWFGVTAENQQRADERIKVLLDTPAAHRWVSCEPLLEQIDLRPYMADTVVLDYGKGQQKLTGGIDLVVAGGESGSRARACKEAWLSDLQKQCAYYEKKFYLKQWGDNYDDEARDTRNFNPWDFSNPFTRAEIFQISA